MVRYIGFAVAALMSLILAGCVLAPGKFTSRLVVNADRSFTFSYQGEVYAENIQNPMSGGSSDADQPNPEGSSYYDDLAPATQKVAFRRHAGFFQSEPKSDAELGLDRIDEDNKNKAIAAALMKEQGYRKVEYLGGGKFLVDYQISGRLDHALVWPFNIDAQVFFPFIATELRANGTVRVMAPGFANSGTSGMSSGMDKMADHLDGTFTLDTDAEIVSQNQEEGAVSAGGRRTVTWKVNSLTRTAPMAVLRMKP